MKIHYISPYRTDKNIGKAINGAICDLRTDPNDWIVHLDHDAMFLLPDSKAQLEEILRLTDYDILGPVTNRLGRGGCQTLASMYREQNILNHIQFAQYVKDRKGNRVVPVNAVLAAFCLCFRVGLWEELGGFTEGDLRFDINFSNEALLRRKRLGVMTGLYVFHTYRMGKDVTDYSHLLCT